MLPRTTAGRLALALFGLAVVLLLARVALTPLVGLPLNYLVVLTTAAASGLVALYAVVLRHERSIAVLASLVLGLLVGLFLLLETLAPPGS